VVLQSQFGNVTSPFQDPLNSLRFQPTVPVWTLFHFTAALIAFGAYEIAIDQILGRRWRRRTSSPQDPAYPRRRTRSKVTSCSFGKDANRRISRLEPTRPSKLMKAADGVGVEPPSGAQPSRPHGNNIFGSGGLPVHWADQRSLISDSWSKR
jgi:hypothetical protein